MQNFQMLKKIMLLFMLFAGTGALSHAQDADSQAVSKNFKNGMTRFYNREYEASISLFNSCLSEQPLNYKAMYYLGYAYLNAGYSKNAIDEWENLIKLGGGNYQVQQKLNDLYFRMSIDKSYNYSFPYVFSKLYDGINDGMHKIIQPSFITYDPENDSIIVTSSKTKYVVEINGSGHVTREFGRNIGEFSSFQFPTGIALSGNRLYVSDYQADSVLIFQRDGNFIGSIGSGTPVTNKRPFWVNFNPLIKKQPVLHSISNLAGPMGLAVSQDDYIFVVDNGNDRIQKFDLSGQWIQSIGSGDLDRPTDIVIKDNVLYISDTYHHRIVSYDTFGNFLNSFGDSDLQEPRGLFLKDNKLYIADAQSGIMIYNLDTSSMEKTGADESKVSEPFGVCLDSKNILYETDLATQNIAIYTPLQLQYANLNLSIPQIWLANYPDNTLHMRIWDKAGNPVNNLKEDDIELYEEGTRIPFVRLGGTLQYRDNLDAEIIVDKSLSMKNYEPELKDFLNSFLNSTSGNDWLNISVINDNYVTSGRIKSSVLWPIDYINKQAYSAPYPSALDEALYTSVRNLLNVNRNKAIILISSGESGPDTFKNYDPDMLVTYARQNAIPIYVINFSDNNDQIYRRLASETLGSYYTVNNIKNILGLYQEIKSSLPLEYTLNYHGLNLRGLKNYWVNVHVKINYKGLVGVEDTGYFVPETGSDNGFLSGTPAPKVKLAEPAK